MEYAKLILLATFCASIHADARNKETMKETMPGYAITEAVDLLNSSRCRTEMEEYRDSVDRGVLWSLRMLDANGEPNSGFTSGNNYWMGSRQQCDFLTRKVMMPLSKETLKNNSLYRNAAEEYPPFDLHFFGAQLIHNSTMQYHIGIPKEDVIVLGLCMPASCTANEIGMMLMKVLDERTLLIGQLYSADFKLIRISDLVDDHRWLLSGKIITIILILTSVVGLATVGTLYDVMIYQRRLKKKKEFLTFENNNTAELKNDVEEKREHDQEDVLAELKPENRFERILMCFSIYTNVKTIFNVESSSEDIFAFHGLRFFGMLWIIMVHTIFYGIIAMGNKALGFMMTSSYENQILGNATLSVDTFLFLSGFLLAFVFIKGQDKEPKVMSFRTRALKFFGLILKRYLRLTPAYFITILIVILNFSWHEKFSLIYFAEPVHELCSKYWWRNLLYINNFYNWDEMCLSWSWYLANDFQFFIYGSMLMILSTMYFYTSIAIGVVTIILSTLVHAYMAYNLNYTPTFEKQYATLSYLYIQPWNRIPPYIIGMGIAVLLSKWNYKLHLSKKTLAVGWSLGVLCNCSILFGITNKNISFGLSIFYEAVSRLAWGIGIAWLVVACATNNGGIINKFLTMRAWVPMSRLTYGAYLLNPFLILSVSTFSSYPLYIDFLTTGTITIGIFLATYICSIGFSAIAETPIILLLRMINSSNSRIK